MTIPPFKKGSLLIPSGPARHLYIICNDPVFYPEKGKECILAVNITSIQPNVYHDDTCILNHGEHNFIHHPSFVFYKKADIFGAERIVQNLADGTISIHDDFNDAVFEKILTGFQQSNDVKWKIRSFYDRFCLS